MSWWARAGEFMSGLGKMAREHVGSYFEPTMDMYDPMNPEPNYSEPFLTAEDRAAIREEHAKMRMDVEAQERYQDMHVEHRGQMMEADWAETISEEVQKKAIEEHSDRFQKEVAKEQKEQAPETWAELAKKSARNVERKGGDQLMENVKDAELVAKGIGGVVAHAKGVPAEIAYAPATWTALKHNLSWLVEQTRDTITEAQRAQMVHMMALTKKMLRKTPTWTIEGASSFEALKEITAREPGKYSAAEIHENMRQLREYQLAGTKAYAELSEFADAGGFDILGGDFHQAIKAANRALERRGLTKPEEHRHKDYLALEERMRAAEETHLASNRIKKRKRIAENRDARLKQEKQAVSLHKLGILLQETGAVSAETTRLAQVLTQKQLKDWSSSFHKTQAGLQLQITDNILSGGYETAALHGKYHIIEDGQLSWSRVREVAADMKTFEPQSMSTRSYKNLVIDLNVLKRETLIFDEFKTGDMRNINRAMAQIIQLSSDAASGADWFDMPGLSLPGRLKKSLVHDVIERGLLNMEEVHDVMQQAATDGNFMVFDALGEPEFAEAVSQVAVAMDATGFSGLFSEVMEEAVPQALALHLRALTGGRAFFHTLMQAVLRNKRMVAAVTMIVAGGATGAAAGAAIADDS